MRKSIKGFIVVTLFFGGIWSHAASPSEQIQIMSTGQYHGDEITARFGIARGWFALIVSDKQAELVPSSPKISRVFDPVVDDEEMKSSYSAKLVEDTQHDPLLMIKASWLKTGPIVQAKLTENRQGFVWNDMHFNMVRACGKASSKDSLLQCKVELSDGKSRQFIIDTAEPNQDYSDEFASTVEIVWAGDIDRDGKPDFILLNTHYNGENTQLFLSSEAEKKKFVKSVARVYRVGC